MLCSCLEASLPVLLSYGIEKERHQETHLGGDTAIRQRWCDVFTTRMQKTKDIVHNPISEEALELIGYSPDKRGKVFPDFKDSMTQAPLKNWLKDAGITKHISYHCSRHSFACLQLDAGTSIAVVQRYLGHKNVATTEVYAKISDAQKRASVGCITLKK